MSLDRARLVSSREFEDTISVKMEGTEPWPMGLERCMFSFDVEEVEIFGVWGRDQNGIGKVPE